MAKQSIREFILNRLNQFVAQGTEAKLDYQASINDFSDIDLLEQDFNRILYSLCVFTAQKENNISINVNNCSQFFILSIDCKEADLISGHEGTPLPLESLDSPLSFLYPFKDQLQPGLDHFGHQQLILRIPLKCHEDSGSPLLRAS